jgi:hypothetical protein
MLTLVFGQASTPKSHSGGPFSFIRFDGPLIRAPDGQVIARHRDHNWEVGNELFFRVDCEALIEVQFEDGKRVSSAYGPYKHVSSADGIMYLDREQFARLDERNQLWYSAVAGGEWPVVVVRPVVQR